MKSLQQKIDEFVRLGNEIDAEIKKRYGREGFLFHEADGGVYAMSGDANGQDRMSDRQKFIKVWSTSNARWGAGAW